MDALRRALGRLSLLYALIFFVFALLHAGITVGPVSQPVIVPAAIVETLCVVVMASGAYGALAGRDWAWDGLIYSHAAALGGVLLGILALTFAPSEPNVLLTWYHAVMATALAAGLGGAFYVSRVRR
ncbi:hypothetical protein SAMN05444920_13067 [Nonomuraea solani]|uniref:Uncharacterized protein n=1 Tax=Nonomuraea solani TaxID=1144553 RepID=A0A1H6EZQ8_9ACTN|nr:hypothetical protein [Nonomuraea solani]SEH02843.1 hypothetical protein SAMN05444920_13067 [Nonomuraea solani]